MIGCPWKKTLIGVVCSLLWAGGAQAQTGDKRPATVEDSIALAKRIDQILLKRLQDTPIKPAPPAEDSVYFRRLHLDLAGRIPSLLEVRDFLDDDRPDKRSLWVEKLLTGDRFIGHFATVMRSFMIPGKGDLDNVGSQDQFETWLREKLKANEGYDQIAKNLLTGLRSPGSQGSPSAFYVSNGNQAEDLAGATARVLLGVKLECAQCHAHPFADWTREQFWQMAAFFNRTKVKYTPEGQFVRPEIDIPGTKRKVKATFLDGKAPGDSSPLNGPTVLADWIITRENPYFSRAAVDNVWTNFLGQSLLEPLQEDTGGVTHPELLDLLAQEFADHYFDPKFLVRAIIYSETYQRSSASPSDDPEALATFARMHVRGLSAEQLYDSFLVATLAPQPPRITTNLQLAVLDGPVSPRLEFLLKFADQGKRTETQTSILQALFLMNGKFLADRIDPRKNKMLPVLATAPTTAERRIETLYLIVLSRYPRPEELNRLVSYVQSGGPTGNRVEALADVYWALLNCSEFMLNH